MIEIQGIVLGEEYKLIGFMVNDNGKSCVLTKETIAKKSEEQEIKNGYVRKELLDEKEHIFVDLDEEVTENVVSQEEAIRKYGVIL